MAIDATFLHEDGYKFNIVYDTAQKFIRSLERERRAVFVNAVDFSLMLAIYPSNLPDYKYNNYRTGKPKAKQLY